MLNSSELTHEDVRLFRKSMVQWGCKWKCCQAPSPDRLVEYGDSAVK